MSRLALVLALSASACGATLGPESSGSPSVTVDVIVPTAPPPDQKDPPRPAPPGFGYIWVAGHWDNLDGNYIWKAGRWVQGRPDYEYVRARYDFDAAKQAWIYHRPHWKKRHQLAATPAVAVDGGAVQPPPAPVPPPGDAGTTM